jgi:hypothetical protein
MGLLRFLVLGSVLSLGIQNVVAKSGGGKFVGYTQAARSCAWNPAALLLESDNTFPTCGPIIDDDTDPVNGFWGPWTNRPYCGIRQNQTAIKYCVYTHLSYDGYSGFSISTNPYTASYIAGFFKAKNPGKREWTEFHIANNKNSAPYKIMDIPGKGKGIVATRNIRQDEVILSEFPYLVDVSLFPDGHKAGENVRLLQQGFNQLPKMDRKRVLKMAHHAGGNLLVDIMNTNAFAVIIDGIDHSGLYAEISVGFSSKMRKKSLKFTKPSAGTDSGIQHRGQIMIANRSKGHLEVDGVSGVTDMHITSSTYTTFSPRSMEMTIIAYHDIKEGEEITVSCEQPS